MRSRSEIGFGQNGQSRGNGVAHRKLQGRLVGGRESIPDLIPATLSPDPTTGPMVPWGGSARDGQLIRIKLDPL